VIKELWKREKEVLLDLLDYADEWEINSMSEMIQEVLKRYISKKNCYKALKKSNRKDWKLLNNNAIKFINDLQLGIEIHPSKQFQIIFEFFDFSDRALDAFAEISDEITHLICSRGLTEEAPFSDLVNRCPKLKGVSIHNTNNFSDRLDDMPSDLQELDVAMCPWMSNENLMKLILICPNLNEINLSSNGQINYAGWTALMGLSRLQTLNISKCFRVDDEEIKLIATSCKNLTRLTIQELTRITDVGFYELARKLPALRHLDASKTSISNAGLLEVVTHCTDLTTLKLNRCKSVTEAGILEALENASQLREIEIKQCDVSNEALAEMREAHTFVNVIF